MSGIRTILAVHKLASAAALAGALALGGCGDLTKELGGLEGGGLQTVKAPPLALPPDYNLRPPAPGARGAPGVRATDAARQSVFGQTRPGEPAPGQFAPPTSQSAGEQALVRTVTARTGAETGIRATVDRETQELKENERGFVDKVLKWDEDAPEGEAIDPDEEQDIIRDIIGTDEAPQTRRKGGLFN